MFSLSPLCPHHDEVENGSGYDSDDQKQRRTGVVVDDDDEDDDAKDEDEDGQDERHADGTLTIWLLETQVQQSRQRNALE